MNFLDLCFNGPFSDSVQDRQEGAFEDREPSLEAVI